MSGGGHERVCRCEFFGGGLSSSDAHNPVAWRWWLKSKALITISPIALFEAENTIRGFSIGKKCSTAEAETTLEGIQRAMVEGLNKERSMSSKRILNRSRRLSQQNTVDCTYGALDIIHVATALELEFATFLTFDKRQAKLANAEGLTIQP